MKQEDDIDWEKRIVHLDMIKNGALITEKFWDIKESTGKGSPAVEWRSPCPRQKNYRAVGLFKAKVYRFQQLLGRNGFGKDVVGTKCR